MMQRRAADVLLALVVASALCGKALAGQLSSGPYESKVSESLSPSSSGRVLGAPAVMECTNASACLRHCPLRSFLEARRDGTRPSSARVAQQARSLGATLGAAVQRVDSDPWQCP